MILKLSPIVTPLSTMAFIPIQTLLPIFTGRDFTASMGRSGLPS